MRYLLLAAGVLTASLAHAHDSVVPHAHPHGIDAVFLIIGAVVVAGLLWYLGLPPFEKKAAKEIVRHHDGTQR